jgi:hypothetical protein
MRLERAERMCSMGRSCAQDSTAQHSLLLLQKREQFDGGIGAVHANAGPPAPAVRRLSGAAIQPTVSTCTCTCGCGCGRGRGRGR